MLQPPPLLRSGVPAKSNGLGGIFGAREDSTCSTWLERVETTKFFANGHIRQDVPVLQCSVGGCTKEAHKGAHFGHCTCRTLLVNALRVFEFLLVHLRKTCPIALFHCTREPGCFLFGCVFLFLVFFFFLLLFFGTNDIGTKSAFQKSNRSFDED